MSDRPLMARLGLDASRMVDEPGDQRLVLALVLSVAMLAALALSLVWLNLERTNLAYKVRELQRQVQEGLDLNAKLGIERDHLLSPHELGKKAEAMGLGSARPGQIRRLETPPRPGENGMPQDKSNEALE